MRVRRLVPWVTECPAPAGWLRHARAHAWALGLVVSFLYFRVWATAALRAQPFFWPKWLLGLVYDLAALGAALVLLAALARFVSDRTVRWLACATVVTNWVNFELSRHIGQPFLPQALSLLSMSDVLSGYGLELAVDVLEPLHLLCAVLAPVALLSLAKPYRMRRPSHMAAVACALALFGGGATWMLGAVCGSVTDFPRTLTWNFYGHGLRHWVAHALSSDDVVGPDYAVGELSTQELERLQSITRNYYGASEERGSREQPLFRVSATAKRALDGARHSEPTIVPASNRTLAASGSTARKNVVMIHLESFRGASFDGLSDVWTGMTPRLSARMKQGAYFTRAFTNALPSDRSVTSMYCSTPVPDKAIAAMYRPRPRVRCLPELLEKAGYRNARFSGIPSSFQQLGEFFSEHGVPETYGSRELDEAFPHPRLARIPESGYDASKLYDERMLFAVRQWIEQHRRDADARPFFLILETMTNHVPWELPSDELGAFDRHEALHIGAAETGTEETARYHRTVRLTDDYVSDFLEWLDGVDAGRLKKDTIVVLYADHPPWFPEPKFERYDKVIKESWIPLFILGLPASENGAYTHPVSLFDVAPTLLNLLGVSSAHSFIGKDLFDAHARRWMSFSRPGEGRIFFASGERFHFSGGRRARLRSDLSLEPLPSGRDPEEEEFSLVERFLVRKLAIERTLMPPRYSGP